MRKFNPKQGALALLCLFTTVLLWYSCTNASQSQAHKPSSGTDSIAIKKVSAIAKITAAEGLITVAAPIGGIVESIAKNVGDTVQQQDIILILKAETKNQDQLYLQRQIAAQQERATAERLNIQQYEASLREKQQELASSQRLADKGAETRQNVYLQEKEREVISTNLQVARQHAKAAQRDVQALQAQLHKLNLLHVHKEKGQQ